MNILVFSTQPTHEHYLRDAAQGTSHRLEFTSVRLGERTAPLAAGFDAVCAFVNDQVSEPVITSLRDEGVRHVLLRCAGWNNVDLPAARAAGMNVARVPGYSPEAVAEHCTGLLLMLARQLHKAYNRVREGNFSLEGLLGVTLAGRTVGVVGTGQIGACFCRIMRGFGCEVLASDPRVNPECEAAGVRYVDLDTLLQRSDVVALHCPLTPATRHTIDSRALSRMKPGAVLLNTSRGGLVDTRAVIDALKSRRLGALGIDVYEEEADYFFEDFSGEIIEDDVLARLMTFPNVVVTGHQAFFTREAMLEIARQTLANADRLDAGEPCENLLSP